MYTITINITPTDMDEEYTIPAEIISDILRILEISDNYSLTITPN